MELPKQFLVRMKELLQDEFDDFINSYQDSPVKSFFVNENKILIDKFKDVCDWNIIPYKKGFILNDEVKVGKSIEHHSGMIYMQELSAMMPTTFLPLVGDEWVLDMCASPGGKSIQVANRLKTGFLVSNEIVKSRAQTLQSNIERMGLKNMCVTNNEPSELSKCFEGVFDAIVVDAPCSGEGMFRKDVNAITNWSPEHVESCAKRQLNILEEANKMLKENGYLLYSTCTFSVEENERVVKEFVNKHNYKIIPLYCEGATNGIKFEQADTENTLRFYPHKFSGEGQFVALLQKMEKSNYVLKDKIHLKPLKEFKTEYLIFKQFCEATLNNWEDIINKAVYNNNTIYYSANKKLAEAGARLINCGVKLGEIIKGRFEPNHNLVTVFGDKFKTIIDLDNVGTNKYLKGEVLNISGFGYVALSYKGVVFAFGKASNVIKNHYPKGLRNLN